MIFFFFSSRRRHTRYWRDWSSDVCSSDLLHGGPAVSTINGSGTAIFGNTITGTNGPAIEINASATGTIVGGNTLSGNQADMIGAGMVYNSNAPPPKECPTAGVL